MSLHAVEHIPYPALGLACRCRYAAQLYFPADWSYQPPDNYVPGQAVKPQENQKVAVVLRSLNGSMLPYSISGGFPRAGTTPLIDDQEKCGSQVG